MWKKALLITSVMLVAVVFVLTTKVSRSARENSPRRSTADLAVETNRATMIMEGRHTFRFDTFGDESFWGDVLHLHQAIAGAKLGGVGPGVSPKTALAVGLTVEVDALPASLASALELGQVNLNDPATTLALLKLNSVIQCALCHSTVDDSFLASAKWASTQRCVGRSLVKVGGT